MPLVLVGLAESKRHLSLLAHSVVYVTPPEVIATGPDFSQSAPSTATEYSSVPASSLSSIVRVMPPPAVSVSESALAAEARPSRLSSRHAAVAAVQAVAAA